MRAIAWALALAAVPLAAGTASAEEFRDTDLSLTTDDGLQVSSVSSGARPDSSHYAKDHLIAGLQGVDMDSTSSNTEPTILGAVRSMLG
ncbi:MULTISPECIES: hypothetical protein [Actinokineospora]|uniref:Uncharacterized protein n=1 Tax=Actinokineospora fastidiosa TaxID=1816 RepID=A0A918G217_9PSEU|nr:MULTISPECIES: hypothetical protein [Actinokineospora]UVS76860.1 hypothetical protein Actkin_00555 [Actinokineospora sp. UTMC 2448]GGS15284.1 hypothetical protein GCM10010171_04100 [Actinokineospora fastidiosa]